LVASHLILRYDASASSAYILACLFHCAICATDDLFSCLICAVNTFARIHQLSFTRFADIKQFITLFALISLWWKTTTTLILFAHSWAWNVVMSFVFHRLEGIIYF